MHTTTLIVGLQLFSVCHSYDIIDNVDRMKQQVQYVKMAAPPPALVHEVILAVKQLNLVSFSICRIIVSSTSSFITLA